MTTNHRNGEPAYRRIQKVIRKRIESGKLRPGDVVDSERELAKIHKVSLMTARHALADLAREGVVERRHGAGTFVAPPKIHFNKLMSYTEQMASRGLSARSKIIRISSVDSEAEIAARLSLPADEPAYGCRTRSSGGRRAFCPRNLLPLGGRVSRSGGSCPRTRLLVRHS